MFSMCCYCFKFKYNIFPKRWTWSRFHASEDDVSEAVCLSNHHLPPGHQKLGVTLSNTEEGWTGRERRFSMYSVSTDASTVSTSLQFSDTSQSTPHKLEETESPWQSLEDFDLDETCENNDMDSDGFGYLLFNTDYDNENNRLTVFLKKAEDLPYMGQEKTYDTFVRVTVLPCKRKYFKSSRIVKNALNPEFQEYFTFPIEKKDLQKQTLRLSLFDYSRQGRHDAIGHVLVSMYQVVLQRTKNYRIPLTPQSLPLENLGQVLLALSYSSTKSLLKVSVLRGRDYRINPAVVKTSLKNLCNKDKLDTFVKVTLMCSGQKVKTMKTSVMSSSQNPLYNQSFHFVVPVNFLDDSSVVVTAMAKGSFNQNAVIGRIVCGPFLQNSGGNPTFWGEMLLKDHQVVKWQTLYH
ncbi:synaptotagmin-1-like isoform X1 [Tachypleus tridentatus]|uniref:synaptotagmin-1-like isoform X1 n=2 Tax=Tachypleus tridentatus TaxID=6853 RepID=UPI003FD0B65A